MCYIPAWTILEIYGSGMFLGSGLRDDVAMYTATRNT